MIDATGTSGVDDDFSDVADRYTFFADSVQVVPACAFSSASRKSVAESSRCTAGHG